MPPSDKASSMTDDKLKNDTMNETLFNSEITKEEFLQKYWNKKPLLFKGAIPHAAKLAGPGDLRELSEDEDFETRVVYKDQQKRKMVHGPIDPKDFERYAKGDFALICHNLNTLAPEFYELEKAVDFVPKWEFDDVMSVYSNSGMSLGAHIDNYNVFILQGQGGRTWEIQERPDVYWREDEEIKVLKSFTPDYAWELGPGDLIYIPPGVAHHGVSLDESISYSIGFKSLESVDVIGEYMAELKQNSDSPFFSNQSFNKKSSSDAPEDFFGFIKGQAVDLLGEDFQTWFKMRLSRPKFPINSVGAKAPSTYGGLVLQRDANLKYALFPEGEFSINEKLYKTGPKEEGLLIDILDSSPFDELAISEEAEKKLRPILDELYESGCLFEV